MMMALSQLRGYSYARRIRRSMLRLYRLRWTLRLRLSRTRRNKRSNKLKFPLRSNLIRTNRGWDYSGLATTHANSRSAVAFDDAAAAQSDDAVGRGASWCLLSVQCLGILQQNLIDRK